MTVSGVSEAVAFYEKVFDAEMRGGMHAKIRDPFGHEWSLATHLKDVTDEELDAAAAEMFSGGPPQ